MKESTFEWHVLKSLAENFVKIFARGHRQDFWKEKS